MLKRAIIFAINAYKKTVSPLLGPHCRYYPDCSSYSIEAIERYGPLRGLGMALMRILRCNRFFEGGHDPVVRENVSRETFRPWRAEGG